jgi:ribosomal-protein-alanine N-acetyltransferase
VHISTIAVHPEWRGKRLGELLLLTAMEQALGLGAGLVTLEVRASNDVAQHLYRKYGFRFKGVHRGYYRDGEDAWLMAVEVDGRAYRTRLADLRQALMGQVCCRRTGIGQKDRDTL